MYSLSDLVKGLQNPKLAAREMNILYHSRLGRRPYHPDGVDVVAEDWDNLVILDACRYDVFEQYHTFEDGRLEHRISKACGTPVFLEANFGGRTLDDTVYVNCNPMFEDGEKYDAQFFKVVNLWETDWDDEERTVLPEVATERAIEVSQEFPDKRLIVHFDQPHQPFIPSEREYSRHGPGKGDADEGMHRSFWYKMMTGEMDLDRETIWNDYVANFEHALPAVKKLVDTLGGKTVITADHGNMIGERGYPIPVREWGHWGPQFYDPLVKVPWYVIDGERRDIVAEDVEEKEAVDGEEVKKKLRDLGYAP
ncbi:MAG: hypothetical protein SVU88_02735 [Candidatus Nanohaloarchaea archaeon]|nr:hypothetical protein [Candidatus Nanohaloarchaea archaeon]